MRRQLLLLLHEVTATCVGTYSSSAAVVVVVVVATVFDVMLEEAFVGCCKHHCAHKTTRGQDQMQ